MIGSRKRYIPPSALMAASLVQEGWFTPNAYANHYAEFPDESGVYLFMEVRVACSKSFGQYRVLYVGKSLNLKERQNGHEIFALIRRDHDGDIYIQRWFRPLKAEAISSEEVRLIKRFNPPYNIIHRVRGI